jgi:hypothetical protein
MSPQQVFSIANAVALLVVEFPFADLDKKARSGLSGCF